MILVFFLIILVAVGVYKLGFHDGIEYERKRAGLSGCVFSIKKKERRDMPPLTTP